jgi:hypothetical protein
MASSSSKAAMTPGSHYIKPPAQQGRGRGSARGQGGRGRGAVISQPTPSHFPQQHGEPTKDSQSTSAGNVNWDNNLTLTTKLIQWLLSHTADQHILFHDHATSTHIPIPGDKASGKNKKEVQAVIARYLFENDPSYGSAYALDPGKFSTLLNNRLST